MSEMSEALAKALGTDIAPAAPQPEPQADAPAENQAEAPAEAMAEAAPAEGEAAPAPERKPREGQPPRERGPRPERGPGGQPGKDRPPRQAQAGQPPQGNREPRREGRPDGGRPGGDRREGRPMGGRPEMFSDIDIDKLMADPLYLDNQAHAVVSRMRDMDSGTKSQLRRFYNAVRRACRTAEADRQHQFVMLRARLAYTIARHSLRSLDSLERLLLQVTRKNDARGYERFRDLFEAIVAYNE